MTTEEKLQHFYAFSMESACREAEQILSEYKSALNTQFETHKEAKLAEADQQLNDQINEAKREINKTLSAEQLNIRRLLSGKEREIKQQLFDEVRTKLMVYKTASTDQYLELLCRKIKEAQTFAGTDAMTIYIDPSDAALAAGIETRTGITPTISKEVFLGGMRAVIHSKNILIDHSFTTLLQEAKENFTFDGGMAR